MNKKLLLLALPALMVLSGCSGVKSSPKANLMAEDNLAHEEIFGAAIEAGELGMKKQAPRRLASLSTWDGGFVKVGYQINYKAADETLSIRFVAAIKDAGVTAYWHRGMAQPNGYEGANVSGSTWKFKFSDYDADDEGMESTKIYSTLSDGTNTITAGSGDFAGYSGFAIYTVTGIPYETYKDSYFAAYVILAEDGAPSNMIKSKAQAIKIEKSGTSSVNRFFFDPTITGHFLEGTIGGTLFDGGANGLYRESSNIPDGNYAWYDNVSLNTTDSFGSFYYGIDNESHWHFQFFGAHEFFAESAGFFEKAGLSGFCKPLEDGIYDLSISSGNANHVYTSASSFTKSLSDLKSDYDVLYLEPGIWETNDARFAVNFYGGTGTWLDMEKATVNGKTVYKCDLDADALTNTHIIFCRMNKSEPANIWGNKFNQTDDLSFSDKFSFAGPVGVYKITGWGSGNSTGEWLGGCSDINL